MACAHCSLGKKPWLRVSEAGPPHANVCIDTSDLPGALMIRRMTPELWWNITPVSPVTAAFELCSSTVTSETCVSRPPHREEPQLALLVLLLQILLLLDTLIHLSPPCQRWRRFTHQPQFRPIHSWDCNGWRKVFQIPKLTAWERQQLTSQWIS